MVGGNPRGIAFTPDSSKVYLSAESGQRSSSTRSRRATLRTLIPLLPGEPRHMVIDKAGKYLYLSLNKGGGVVKIDIAQKRVVDRVSTGKNPRTIVLAPDGRSLYVVNYESQTVVKVRTRDMVVLQRLDDEGRPPGGHRLRREDPHRLGRLLPRDDRALRRPLEPGRRCRPGRARYAAGSSRWNVAPLPWPGALRPGAAAHRLREGTHDREPDPGPARGPAACRVHPVEALEHRLELVLAPARDPRP